MRIPLAKYSANEILAMILICGIMAYALFPINPFLTALPAIVFLFTLYFFRDPERTVPPGDNLLVSPADGTILSIEEVEEETFLKEPTIKISIFLSVFNVHLNRAPCAGKVTMLDYRPGKFLVASEPKASQQNERTSIGFISNSRPKIMIRQIAGIIAQRIVCDLKLNQEVKKGQRIGMIKFGSRTEIYIPKNKVEQIRIKVKDKVKGGESIIGEIKA